MTYRKDSVSVLYRTKMKPVAKKTFGRLPCPRLDRNLTVHNPNKKEQRVRYYRYNTTVSREKRSQTTSQGKRWLPGSRRSSKLPRPRFQRNQKSAGPTSSARSMRPNPRTCPKCQGEMRIISFVHQEESHTIFPFKLLSNLLHSPQSKNQDGNNYEYKRIEAYFQKIGERDHSSISQFHKFLF